jgi:hypothetical protein
VSRPADQGGGAGPQQRWLLYVPPGDGKHEAEAAHRGDDEREQLERQAEREGRDPCRDSRGDRDEAQRERERDQLGDAEHGRYDQPDDPRHHGRSAGNFSTALPCRKTSWHGQIARP